MDRAIIGQGLLLEPLMDRAIIGQGLLLDTGGHGYYWTGAIIGHGLFYRVNYEHDKYWTWDDNIRPGLLLGRGYYWTGVIIGNFNGHGYYWIGAIIGHWWTWILLDRGYYWTWAIL